MFFSSFLIQITKLIIIVFFSVRTPGGRLVYLYVKKPRTVPKCGQCKEKLKGITPTRPSERPRMSRRVKTVSRSFGGVLCHRCLRERIIRAFLIDEQKVVKVLKAAQATSVKAPRPAKVVKVVKPTTKVAPAPKTGKGAAAGKTAGKAAPAKQGGKPALGGKSTKAPAAVTKKVGGKK